MNKISKKKKVYVIVAVLVLLFSGMFYMYASGANEDSVLEKDSIAVSNDNMDMGYENASEVPDSKLEANDAVKDKDKDDKESASRGNDIFSELNVLDKMPTENEKVNTGTNEFAAESNTSRSYERAQKQLRDIESRKKQRAAEQARKQRLQEQKARLQEEKEEEAERMQQWEAEKDEMNGFFESSSSNHANTNYNQSNANTASIMNDGPTDHMILASVKGTQIITKGERVTLVLEDDYIINGILYSRNTRIYGISNFNGHRVKLSITKINHDHVNLVAYDAQDGLEGIYIKGESIVGESVKEGVQDGLDEINIGSVPVGSTIKNIFKKRQKAVKVNLLNDYHVVLKPKE